MTLAMRRAEKLQTRNRSGDGANGDDAWVGPGNERTNAARAAAKASLRFASHCEATLCAREASALGEKSEIRDSLDWNSIFGAPDATAAAAFHPKGLEPTLARHALLALAGGAGARARHLVPRVLASLRGDDSSTAAATAAEFARLAPRVPSWLFLEWLPQLYSLLDTPGPGGDAALAVVESLASTYPSAAYAEHRVARAEFSSVGAARCARRVDATLVSPAGEAFARGDSAGLPRAAPGVVARARQAARRRAAAPGGAAAEAATRAAAEAAFGAAEAAVCDVGEPDEPHLGALNRRFAQLAKGPLGRAMARLGGSFREARWKPAKPWWPTRGRREDNRRTVAFVFRRGGDGGSPAARARALLALVRRVRRERRDRENRHA